MNPFDVPQNQKEKECHNLDESQSSSVSIKIFNNNEDNVVIRLYRNNKKGSRDRSRNSFGHPSRRSGRSFAGKDKNKPTMLRNLYRNTFGPTLDETVLVGMETFQMCQHGAHPNSLANTSDEGFQKNGRSIIPNELSWDCSTLLPTNANGKQFESVCTSTSNCALDRERNLSPLVTNQYQFDPFSNKSDTALSDEMQGMMTAEAIRSFAEATRVEDNLCHLNNISSDENLTLQPNFRRRSSGNSNSGRELSDLVATDGAPQKRRTAIHKSVRKSSGYDAPPSRFSFSEAPRYSTRHSTRQPSTSMGRSFVEDPNYALPIDEKGGMCKCCPDISKNGAIERRTTEFQSIAQPSRKCTFHDTLTQNYYRDPSFNSEPYEEDLSDLEGNTRRSTVQRRSTSPGSREPSRKMSTKIADFFRKNSKKSTSPDLSFPDKTVEGYVRTASNEDMPHLSIFSRDTSNDDPRKSRLSSVPRRSTVARKTVTEVGPEKCRRSTSPKRSSFLRKSLKEDKPDDDPIKEENFRKSTIGAEDRESKGFVSNLRKSSFPAKSESNEEIPQQEEHQKCRRTITPRKSSAARKTFLEDDDPAEEKSTTEGRESKGFVNTPRKCTASPCSSIPAKSIEIDGPLEEDVDNDILPAQQQEYRRSSTPRSSRPSSARKSYHEGEEEIPRRSFLPEGRESKASPEILRNPAFSSSTLRNSFEEDLPSTFDEPLRVSTFSPEPPGKEEVHLPGNSGKSRQISTQQPDEVHVCEKPRLGVCRCEKEDTSRNKVPQETRYAITRVTKYDDYTTYEILKSTRAKPKKIPEVLEKIFIEKEQ